VRSGREVRIGFFARRAGRNAAANGTPAGEEDKARRFKALALPHLDDVYTLARYLLPRADADDAVQECYLRVWRYFDTFTGTAIKPWLLAILRNACLAQRARSGSLVFGEPDHIDGAAERIAPLWGDPPETPELVLIRRGTAVTLRRLFQELPDEFREVLVLRELNGLTYREIAQVTGAPAGTVMSRLAPARQMLREALAAKEGGT
jgi:RNA polymerase sigma-70 factor, ECF subfamily